MRVVIIEDEPLARQNLIEALIAEAPGLQVAALLTSVADSVAWLTTHPQPDLIFLDIQLSDGLSFEIFQRTQVHCPIVFTTAFDDYWLEAFQVNGIDYLLKPIQREKVATALEKYRRLRQHFSGNSQTLLAALQAPRPAFRERFLVRKGSDLLPIKTTDIAYFFSAHKLVFLVTRTGTRYMLDRPLAEVETELDPARFTRANRAFLLSADSVARCSPYGKGKLILELRPPVDEEVTVSQERAATFRQWLGE